MPAGHAGWGPPKTCLICSVERCGSAAVDRRLQSIVGRFVFYIGLPSVFMIRVQRFPTDIILYCALVLQPPVSTNQSRLMRFP